MPWKEASVISLRKEFVDLAKSSGNMSRLCQRFGISRQTGYKWIGRYLGNGEAALVDRSRRPIKSPGKVCEAIEESVLTVRNQHPVWGGRKIRRRLQDLGWAEVPAASTITSILNAMGSSMSLTRASICHFNDLSVRIPTIFGRWTLKDTLHALKVVVIR